jgi:hypothetical protein
MFKFKRIFKFIKCSNFKKYLKVLRKKKEKKMKMKNQKTRKKMKEKTTKKKRKLTYRRVNGPAQHRAHAGGARFRPANGGSIGIAGMVCWNVNEDDLIVPSSAPAHLVGPFCFFFFRISDLKLLQTHFGSNRGQTSSGNIK